MFIYNITIKVNWEIIREWLSWQKSECIPSMMATGLFEQCKMYRLMEQEDEEGPTFVFQYSLSSREQYQEYKETYSLLHSQIAIDKWGDSFLLFSTVMESVN